MNTLQWIPIRAREGIEEVGKTQGKQSDKMSKGIASEDPYQERGGMVCLILDLRSLSVVFKKLLVT